MQEAVRTGWKRIFKSWKSEKSKWEAASMPKRS
jgi:hypothetical protein